MPLMEYLFFFNKELSKYFEHPIFIPTNSSADLSNM